MHHIHPLRKYGEIGEDAVPQQGETKQGLPSTSFRSLFLFSKTLTCVFLGVVATGESPPGHLLCSGHGYGHTSQLTCRLARQVTELWPVEGAEVAGVISGHALKKEVCSRAWEPQVLNLPRGDTPLTAPPILLGTLPLDPQGNKSRVLVLETVCTVVPAG